MNTADKAILRPADVQRFARGSGYAFCPVCVRLVELIPFDKAATLFRTDLQDIQFLARRGEVHRLHNQNGSLMACRGSLFECFDRRRTRLLTSGMPQGRKLAP